MNDWDRSSGPSFLYRVMVVAFAQNAISAWVTARCVDTAPLGNPVVPEV